MTTYINLTKNEYPRHQGDIELNPNDVYAHVEWVDRPEFNPETQFCYEGLPVENNDIWQMTWIVREKTQEELDAKVNFTNELLKNRGLQP